MASSQLPATSLDAVCRHFTCSFFLFDFSARDSKEVTHEEYNLFYQSTFKDFKEPLAWSHFSLTTESGIAFRAILYVPSGLEEKFWQQPTSSVNVRLMVKHVFITSDLGEDALPKWISWVKAVVDGV